MIKYYHYKGSSWTSQGIYKIDLSQEPSEIIERGQPTGTRLYECEIFTLNSTGRQLGWIHNIFSTSLLDSVEEISEEEAAMILMETQ